MPMNSELKLGFLRSLSDQNFSDLLKAREQELGSCIESASVISWACSQTQSEIPGTLRLEAMARYCKAAILALFAASNVVPIV